MLVLGDVKCCRVTEALAGWVALLRNIGKENDLLHFD